MTVPTRPERVRAKRLRTLSGPSGERYRYDGKRLEVSSGGQWVAASVVPVSLIEELGELIARPEEDVDALEEALRTAGLFDQEVKDGYQTVKESALSVATVDELADELKRRGAREFATASMASNALGSQSRRVFAL